MSTARRRVFGAMIFTVALTLALACAATANANGWPKTLVSAREAAVFATPSLDAAVHFRLSHAAMVQVRKEDGDWCDVVVLVPGGGGRTIDAWMRRADLLRSPGIAAFWRKDFETAVASLGVETAAQMSDPALASWLQFYLGYSQWATGRIDLARTTFEAIARRRPTVSLAPHALVAQAKAAAVEREFDAAVAAYQQLLTSFGGDYVCERSVDPYPVSWPRQSDLCQGTRQIPARLQALQQLIQTRAATMQVVTSANARALAKSEAWLALGRAWEQKNTVDPEAAVVTNNRTNLADAKTAFEAAAAAAPGTLPAGHAAWRLIPFSAPYEWEGDWNGQAAWTLEKYGAFVSDYPQHPLTAEAKFTIAMAHWAAAGYPEVYHLAFAPDTASLKGRLVELDRWFDTRGFGGGRGPAVVQHPERLGDVITELRAIIRDHPQTPSAAVAQYYVAVILDYALNRLDDARIEYETFVAKYPTMTPFAIKARARLQR